MSSFSTTPRKSILKNSSQPKKLKAESLFPTTKKDKRRIKHAQLLSKVEKPSSKPRKRRPNKKLVTTLDALADALPHDDGTNTAGSAGSRLSEQFNVIIKRKSIKSRPGAMKRREKLDKGERDRFAKNLAQMSSNIPSASSTPSTHKPEDRWKALRGFIENTMEKRPEPGPLKT